MNARDAGRQGGQQKSFAKRTAARRNGALGGRPRKAELLIRDMRVMYDEIKDQCSSIDPGDLGLIIERMCRPPGSGRRFFIRPLMGGGYGF
jgi:hypothetical protein